MGYTSQEREFSSYFRNGITEGFIPGTGVSIISKIFHSRKGYVMSDSNNVASIFRGLFKSKDLEKSNNDFRYYILIPEDRGRGAIILIHGLNERNWNKYIQWGMRLATDTSRPVVLFPIAYHMNRSPRSWIDRHIMMPLVSARNFTEPDTRMSTYVNVALSTRMSASPQRFMFSGYQTVNDLNDLIRTVTTGEHPYLNGPVDIFAYSIGALVTQVLMLSETSLLTDESRVMFFCGGCAFNLMNGISKLIMDSRAFNSLTSFYLDDIDFSRGSDSESFMKILNDTPEGEAFYAMTSLARLREFAGKPFRNTNGKLRAVVLEGDCVIPPSAVSATLDGAEVITWSPGYSFSHENPFPVLAGEQSIAVDSTFDRLFTDAACFFS
jgi:pimeloyl-ACP methyl ester carboxylesterase